MFLEINIQNVEELIFYDQKLQKLLPEFSSLFGQWKLAKQYPDLRSLGKRSIIDFLNKVTEEQTKIIEKHLGARVKFARIDSRIIRNYKFELKDFEESLDGLNEIDGFSNFFVSRNESQIYISFWR